MRRRRVNEVDAERDREKGEGRRKRLFKDRLHDLRKRTLSAKRRYSRLQQELQTGLVSQELQTGLVSLALYHLDFPRDDSLRRVRGPNPRVLV